MDCDECGGPVVAYEVPEPLHEHVGREYAATCTRCLALSDASFGGEPDFSSVSDGFPEGEAGAAMALVLGLLGSLALNRTAIEGLIEAVEHGGSDPLLVLDRLASQGNVSLHFDACRRRHQLEQLL